MKKSDMVDFAVITAGCFLFALAFKMFMYPNFISPGGASGIALIINHFTGIPVGACVIVLNIPLFIVSYKKLGRGYLRMTLYSAIASSLLIDVMEGAPEFTDDLLLASIYGGAVMGAGLAMVFSRGATTGGSDTLAKLVRLSFPHIRTGRMLLYIDIAIVALSAVAVRDINRALYAAAAIYVSSISIDALLHGVESSNLVIVVSNKHSEISDAIQNSLCRGVTLLNGAGAYSGKDIKIVMCAIKKQQEGAFYKILDEYDRDAFTISIPSARVIGEGFGNIYKT